MRTHRCLAFAMAQVSLIAGLAGCGAAPSDNSPPLERRASLGGPAKAQPVSQLPPPSRADPGTPAASPALLASGRSPEAHVEAHPGEPLPVVPDWMGTALRSPEVRVRLQALDRWEQQAPTGSIDPVIAALNDEDEEVQTKAIEILERHWETEQEGD
jgi:hypothetical protein